MVKYIIPEIKRVSINIDTTSHMIATARYLQNSFRMNHIIALSLKTTTMRLHKAVKSSQIKTSKLEFAFRKLEDQIAEKKSCRVSADIPPV